VADDAEMEEARGRPPEHLTTTRLFFDSIVTEVLGRDPIVPQRAAQKAPCDCLDGLCVREGVFGFLVDQDIPRLCSDQRELEGAKRERLDLFIRAHVSCANRKDEGESGLDSVDGWITCLISALEGGHIIFR